MNERNPREGRGTGPTNDVAGVYSEVTLHQWSCQRRAEVGPQLTGGVHPMGTLFW